MGRQRQLTYSVSKPYRIVVREFEDILSGKEDDVPIPECPIHDLEDDEGECNCERNFDRARPIKPVTRGISVSRGVLLLVRHYLLQGDKHLHSLIMEPGNISPAIPEGRIMMENRKNYTYLRNITIAKEFELDVDIFKLECRKCGVSVSLAISRLINDFMDKANGDPVGTLKEYQGKTIDYQISVTIGDDK